MTSLRQKVSYSVAFVLIAAGLSALNLYFLVDDSYSRLFYESQALSAWQKLTVFSLLKDPAYFILQNLLGSFVSFPIFFILIIFTSLLIKFRALLYLEKPISLWHVMPYLAVLGFLHEGIQVRIALALSVALWSLVLFVKDQQWRSLLVLLLASTFHLSVLAFLLVYVLVVLHQRFGRRFLFLSILLLGLIIFTNIVPELMEFFGRMTNARYMAYAQSLTEAPNKTGLFQYYFIFIAFLVAFVGYFYQPSAISWVRLKELAMTSACLAIAILLILRFNVIVSSRLADLLLLPLALALGATLVQLRDARQYVLLWGMTFILLVYGGLRGLISFNPQLFKSLVSHLRLWLG